jgi:hypothetical protein
MYRLNSARSARSSPGSSAMVIRELGGVQSGSIALYYDTERLELISTSN